MEGDTVESSLLYVDFNSEDLLASYRKQLASAHLSKKECDEFLKDLSVGLKGYTYFEE